MAFTLEYVLGEDADVYAALLAGIPPGGFHIKRGTVVPSHGPRNPQTFIVGGCRPGEIHYLRIVNDGVQAPRTETFFIPQTDEQVLSLALNPGVHFFDLANAEGEQGTFYVTVTHYGVFFRTYARELTEYSLLPLRILESEIADPLGYRLAEPLLRDFMGLVPVDLELLGALSYKLLVKNYLNNPSSDIGIRESLAAFSVGYPYLYRMVNAEALDNPLYRSEETFGGWEAHCWLPNREVERWLAFRKLISNLPQLYSLQEVSETVITLLKGTTLKEHYFDFESQYANSILEGQASAGECFTRLFNLNLTVGAQHWIDFCQAAYGLDTVLPPLESPETETTFRHFTSSGRFDQQYGISYRIHEWHWDSPLLGTVDGSNVYFNLSHNPSVSAALKLFVDGLLQRLNIDYLLSTGSEVRASSLPLDPTSSLETINVNVGDPRTLFPNPFFASIEVRDLTNLQYVVTGGSQSPTSLEFIISHDPLGEVVPTALHYLTPDLPLTSYPSGATYYGIEALTPGSSSYSLVYPADLLTTDYQLICFLSNGSGDTRQILWFPREKTSLGALIEFSAPIPTSGSYGLNWWVVTDDGVALERGTIILDPGSTEAALPVTFASGPYYDPLIVLPQMWTTTPLGSGPISHEVTSFRELGPSSVRFQWSGAIPDGSYRLDYLVLKAQTGNHLQFFDPPRVGQEVEAHYDSLWPQWTQGAPVPEPDGGTSEFLLPRPCPQREALYLTLNGRLLKQGEGAQYTLGDDGLSLRLKFKPTSEQKLWAVYPHGDFTSRFLQGPLTRPATSGGHFATGSLRLGGGDFLEAGTRVSLRGITLEGQVGAQGLLYAPTRISLGSTLTFVGLGVTLLGVGVPTTVDEFGANVDRDLDLSSLASCINTHPILSLKWLAQPQVDGYLRLRALGFGSGAYNQTLTSGGGSLSIVENIAGDRAPQEDLFPCGLSEALDLQSIGLGIEAHYYLGTLFRTEWSPEDLELRVTALEAGEEGNVVLQGDYPLEARGLEGGTRTLLNPPLLAPALLYADEAPVGALDGAATKRWDLYEGRDFVFWTRPTEKQEPYVISETFPRDPHDLDSQLAPNCSYPLGLFTQGLFSSLGTGEIAVPSSFSESEGGLTITTLGLLLQETPDGPIDGVNCEFYLTALAAGGPSSLQLWVDGIWQSPLEWTYAAEGTRGLITFTDPPTLSINACYLVSTSFMRVPSQIDLLLDTFSVADMMINPLGENSPVQLSAALGSTLPAPLSPLVNYYAVNVTLTTFQLSTSASGSAIDLLTQGSGTFYVNYGGGDQALSETNEVPMGPIDSSNQSFLLNGPLLDPASVLLYLEGAFNLGTQDYTLSGLNILYSGSLTPALGQPLWAHYNRGLTPTLKWRQVPLGLGDGVETDFLIPITLTSELPISLDSTLVFFDGLNQRPRLEFTLELDLGGLPTGLIHFTEPPEAGRRIEVAYLRRG